MKKARFPGPFPHPSFLELSDLSNPYKELACTGAVIALPILSQLDLSKGAKGKAPSLMAQSENSKGGVQICEYTVLKRRES